jgi:hypothetical protein
MKHLILGSLCLWSAVGFAATTQLTKSQDLIRAHSCPGPALLVVSGVDTNNSNYLDNSEIVAVVITCEGNDYPPKVYDIQYTTNCDRESCDLVTLKGFVLRLYPHMLTMLGRVR